MNAADCARKEFGDRKCRHVRETFMLREWNRIGHDNLFNGGITQTLKGRAKKNAVAGTAINITRIMFMNNAYGLQQRATSINLVIGDKRMTPLDVSNNPHCLRQAVVAQTTLLNDGEWRIEAIC